MSATNAYRSGAPGGPGSGSGPGGPPPSQAPPQGRPSGGLGMPHQMQHQQHPHPHAMQHPQHPQHPQQQQQQQQQQVQQVQGQPPPGHHHPPSLPPLSTGHHTHHAPQGQQVQGQQVQQQPQQPHPSHPSQQHAALPIQSQQHHHPSHAVTSQQPPQSGPAVGSGIGNAAHAAVQHQQQIPHSPKPQGPPLTISQNRIVEALDVARKEVDQVFKEITLMKYQKEDAEYKLSSQLNEMTAFQQVLNELERTHLKIKQQYEDEIAKLRREVEVLSSQQQQHHLHQQQHQQQQQPSQQYPPLSGASMTASASGGPPNLPQRDARARQPQQQQQQQQQASQHPQHPQHPQSLQQPAPHMMQQHPDHAMTNANGDDANVPAKRMRLDDGSLSGPPTQRQKLPSTVSTPVLTPQGMKGPPPLSEAHTSQMAPMHGHPSASYQQGQHGQNGQALAQGYPPAAGRTATPPSGSVQPRTAAPQAMPMQQSAQRPPQGDANGTASAATAMQPAAPATPHVDNAPTTGFIDFDARKASDEGRILGEDYACYVNPESESARNPPLHVEPVHTFRVQSVVCCVRFSPDGRYLGVGCSKSTEIYDVETFQRVCALVDDTSRKDYYVRSVAFSPDGNFIASGAEDHLVRICDINRQSIKSRLSGHQLDIYSIDWSKDGKFVASASGDRTVRLWDPETGASLMTLSCDEDPTRSPNTDQSKDTGVTSVAIRPSDSRCVAAGTIDDTIRLWDTRTGQLLERFVGHLNSVYAVAFSPTGLSLVSGSLDKTLRVWDLSQNTLDQLANPNPPPAAPVLAPGTVADTSRKSRTFINTKPRHVFRGHKDFILSVAFPGKGSSLGAVDRQGRPLWSSIPIPEIEWIVCASKDRHVTIWDGSVPGTTPTAVPVCLLSGHRNSVISIAVSSAGGLMATGSGDMRTRIWRVSRRTDPQPVPDVKPNVTNASAAPASAQPAPAASTPTIPAPSPRLDVKGEPRPSSVRAASPAPAPLASHNSMAAQAQPQAYHAASPAPGSAAPPKPAVQPAGPLAAATTSGGAPSNAAPSPAASAAQVAPPVSAAAPGAADMSKQASNGGVLPSPRHASADQPQDAERSGLRASPAPTAAPAPAAPQTKPVVEPAVAVHKDDDGDAEMEMEEGEEREMDLDLDFPPPTTAAAPVPAAAPTDGSDAAKNGAMSVAETSE